MFIIIGQTPGNVRVARKPSHEIVKGDFSSIEEARDWIKRYACDCGNLLFEGPRNGCTEAHVDTDKKKFHF